LEPNSLHGERTSRKKKFRGVAQLVIKKKRVSYIPVYKESERGRGRRKEGRSWEEIRKFAFQERGIENGRRKKKENRGFLSYSISGRRGKKVGGVSTQGGNLKEKPNGRGGEKRNDVFCEGSDRRTPHSEKGLKKVQRTQSRDFEGKVKKRPERKIINSGKKGKGL